MALPPSSSATTCAPPDPISSFISTTTHTLLVCLYLGLRSSLPAPPSRTLPALTALLFATAYLLLLPAAQQSCLALLYHDPAAAPHPFVFTLVFSAAAFALIGWISASLAHAVLASLSRACDLVPLALGFACANVLPFVVPRLLLFPLYYGASAREEALVAAREGGWREFAIAVGAAAGVWLFVGRREDVAGFLVRVLRVLRLLDRDAGVGSGGDGEGGEGTARREGAGTARQRVVGPSGGKELFTSRDVATVTRHR